MKKVEMVVTYYRKTRNSTRRFKESLTWDEYLDLILDDDIIIKKRVWI